MRAAGPAKTLLTSPRRALPVLGDHVAETAPAIARAKARERRMEAEFAAAVALSLEPLRRRSDTAPGCGLFHTP